MKKLIPPPSIKIFLFVFLSVMVLVNACRKTDNIKPEAPVKTENKLEQKFFESHPTSNALINGIKQFVKGENNKYNFLEKLTGRIGFPYWDKAMIYTNSSVQGRGYSDSINLTFIPFVRDSQNYVNASLIVRISGNDTTFRLLYDWQYLNSAYGHPTSDTTAENTALLFIILDGSVFGHKKFKITDSLLFSSVLAHQNGTTGRELIINNSSNLNGRSSFYVTEVYSVCMNNYTCGTPWYCNPRGGCDYLNCLDGQSCYLNFQACFNYEITTWYDEISTGGSGNPGNGGGGDGSGWNNPCGGIQARNNVQDPCGSGGGGWVPIEEPTLEQQLQYWDNNNIIIHSTVRPCINSIINSIKGIRTGTIAGMIFILSQQIPAFNWEIKETPQLNPPYNTADALTTINGPNTNSLTQLNQEKLNNATNISIARTIIHEAIHAFIYNYVTNHGTLTQSQKDQILALPYAKQLKEFLKIKYNQPNQGNQFHNLMAKNFHDAIREALIELCPLLGITLTGAPLNMFCSDMAWGGLQDDDPSSPWMDPNILTDEDRARIVKRLDIELNNLPGFSGYVPDGSGGPGIYVSLTRVGTKACP